MQEIGERAVKSGRAQLLYGLGGALAKEKRGLNHSQKIITRKLLLLRTHEWDPNFVMNARKLRTAGVYLVNVSVNDNLVASYFYNGTNHTICNADETEAFLGYKGNREATLTNIIYLVRNLLAVTGEQAMIVDSPEQIPHKRWQGNHPKESFSRYLHAKGIDLHNPEMLKGLESVDKAGWRESAECNVFVYFSHGGGVIRYEVQCEKGRIVGINKYVLGSGIGDCWYTM